MKDKELKEKIENSRKKESSLRWLSNQVPNNLSDSNEDRMLKCIKKYSLDGANTIEELRNYLINVEDEMYEIRCERKENKKYGKEIIDYAKKYLSEIAWSLNGYTHTQISNFIDKIAKKFKIN